MRPRLIKGQNALAVQRYALRKFQVIESQNARDQIRRRWRGRAVERWT